MFRAVFDAGTTAAVILGVVAAVNSVIAFFYYAGVGRQVWFRQPAEGIEPVQRPTPLALNAAMVLATGVVLVVGLLPAAVRPPRRPRVPGGLTPTPRACDNFAAMTPNVTCSGGDRRTDPSRRADRVLRVPGARALRRGRGLLRHRSRCGARRARLRDQCGDRAALRRRRRAVPRRRVGRASGAPIRSSSSTRGPGGVGWRRACCEPQPECVPHCGTSSWSVRRRCARSSATRWPSSLPTRPRAPS